MSGEIKHAQRHLRSLFHLRSSTAAGLFSLHRWYFDEPCCQKHAAMGKGIVPLRTGGAGCPWDSGHRTEVVPAARDQRVLRADRGGKKLV